MSLSAPPDLRVLVRRLASTSPDDLPHLCPALVKQVLRCAGPLSEPHDPKTRDSSSETSMLVHKLKTHVNSLLGGRSPGGRFAAVILIKAIIDVGGWECLRLSEPWVRGLISTLRKPSAPAAKELSIVALTRIYSLLHGYQTLTREIATPTVGSFADACLQLIKPPASGRPLRLPTSLVEVVVAALTTLVPLYPATLRPFVGQMREAVKRYIAPTSSDESTVPQTLRSVSRHLLISLHHTAPKNGSSEEWNRSLDGFLSDCHATADQVFRAVRESWESSVGYVTRDVSSEGEPHGGGDGLPSWSGLVSGSERLAGLLELLAECFHCPTRSSVTIPLGAVMDLVSRISLLMPPTPGQEDRFQFNPAIGREEKDLLWSVLPDVHVAAIQLLLSIARRLGRNALPLAHDMIDQMVRLSVSTRDIVPARRAVFLLAKELLLTAGPTLDKPTVESLGSLIQACCRDLLDAAGYAQEIKQEPALSGNGAKGARGKGPSGNADAFLAPKSQPSPALVGIDSGHQAVAGELLAALLSHLPQGHLSPDSRGLIDRTAILCHNEAAMVASCLYPYTDKNGRYYPSILPFLLRQFPGSQGAEVLRSHLRVAAAAPQAAWDQPSGLGALLGEPTEEKPIHVVASPGDQDLGAGGDEKAAEIVVPSFLPNPGAAGEGGGQDNPSVPRPETDTTTKLPAEDDRTWSPGTPASPLKRKGDDLEPGAPKRLGKGKEPEASPQAPPVKQIPRDDDDSDSDSGGSVQIDMTLDDEEEEDGEGDLEMD